MGVTLERVQFKFASIIGELCSEPDVLSQFAVWVDLRLAEYKLKGSISLDCSGETPDPVWLKGIKSALLANELASRSQQRPPTFNRRKAPPLPLKSALARSSTVTRDSSDKVALTSTPINNRSTGSSESRLSPIAIKEEPDEIYPISLHVHNPESRKHPLTLDSDSDQPSPSKRERFMDPSTEDAPANESLMSIIGLNENTDKLDSVTQHSESVQNEIDMLMGQDLTDNSELADQSFASNIPSTSSLIHGPSRLGHVDSQNEWMRAGGLQLQRTKPAVNVPKESRLEHLGKTVRCHVKGFERWLQEGFQDCRPIEEIPSTELDHYLTEYYSNAKTQSGMDFSRKSLLRMRNSLERYLKDQRYPASIVHSPAFAPSIRALKGRLKALFLQQAKEEPTDLTTNGSNKDQQQDPCLQQLQQQQPSSSSQPVFPETEKVIVTDK